MVRIPDLVTPVLYRTPQRWFRTSLFRNPWFINLVVQTFCGSEIQGSENGVCQKSRNSRKSSVAPKDPQLIPDS
eukprot:8456950-Heterocapsa_arctica.AAC.1